MKKIGVVITTIANGDFLEKFTAPAAAAAGTAEIKFYIAGDLNTPPACSTKCAAINATTFPCQYLSVKDQEAYLKKVGFPAEYIPYRSDNRRNTGYLKAYEEGCDIIISMDDDNFPCDNNFFTGHSITGTVTEAVPLTAGNRWVNPMLLLDSKTYSGDTIRMYPRGYPYEKRWKDNTAIEPAATIKGKVGINAGLWTGDPDIDAVSRLTTLCNSETGSQWQPDGIYALADKQLMPINTQNTSLIRDAIPAYYFIKMGYNINGMRMDRFGDIFSGYFVQLCNRAVGNIITLGNPFVYQQRNEHNLLKDLSVELPGILIIEDFVPFLESALSPASSYADAYAELVERLVEFTHSGAASDLWTKENLLFIDETAVIMKAWISTCNLLK